MRHLPACLLLGALTNMQPLFAANAYRCPHTTPVDSLHNRSGWYIGAYTPESGSYASTINSLQTIDISAEALIASAGEPHTWTHTSGGGSTAVLATGVLNLASAHVSNINAPATGLNTVAPAWATSSAQSQWPSAPVSGAMHALIIQRNHLKSSAGQARRSHAIQFAKDYMEYRLVGSNDSLIDGSNRGQLVSGGETLEVEVVTEYLAPGAWGNNDFCFRLFNNNNGLRGFEVQLRPIFYVLGKDHSEIATLPNIAGEYDGTVELAFEQLPTTRPLY